MSPTQLNLAFRLVFAYQHQPHLLNDAESFGEVTGLSVADNAETLSMVRGIIEGLQDQGPQRGITLADSLHKAGQDKLHG